MEKFKDPEHWNFLVKVGDCQMNPESMDLTVHGNIMLMLPVRHNIHDTPRKFAQLPSNWNDSEQLCHSMIIVPFRPVDLDRECSIDCVFISTECDWNTFNHNVRTKLESEKNTERVGDSDLFLQQNQNSLFSNSKCTDKIKTIPLRHTEVYTRSIDSRFIGYFMTELRRSQTFSTSFEVYARQYFELAQLSKSAIPTSKDSLFVPRLIVINVENKEREWLDYKWSGRVCSWILKRMLLDDAMNWLNTLGGGYSALGDCFTHHSIEAAKISMRQLKVALEMGDPPTVIRCYLYFALSLMQRGYLRPAKRIIRLKYREAGIIAAPDHRLKAMCHGMWSRLQYYYSIRHLRARDNSLSER